MTGRRSWIIGAVVAAVLLGGASVWIWQSSTVPSVVESPSPLPSPSPTAASAEQVQVLVDDHLEQCAESRSDTPPEGCGIRIPWGAEFSAVSGIRYRIEQLPTAEIQGEGFVAEGGVLIATVTGTGQDGTSRSVTYRSEDWAVRGDVDVTDEGVEISVW
ncbi:hypothetical protein [Microbacterium aurantiacum]|uniref:hypothetical protein n=1 Tax=Microbacterium aurantiacum TaxID=162393 RepID=UPI000C8053B1|nr:hypothetical protein [Microbacterium aurantiacum]